MGNGQLWPKQMLTAVPMLQPSTMHKTILQNCDLESLYAVSQ
eukprot:CAMPEP_0117654352 /NCGR_PEP_ID=MMETSP0804-20121206/3698_1 /TAXON_ID=1074897 /ORGANISM="Tetraselmis astigmatica, Strain CCMP880" /LENGTH=41 /DNA_ID= /DNA_START= /DNA_END= /DNA_ORIENTATION=